MNNTYDGIFRYRWEYGKVILGWRQNGDMTNVKSVITSGRNFIAQVFLGEELYDFSWQ